MTTPAADPRITALRRIDEILAGLDAHERMESDPVEYRGLGGGWFDVRDDLLELREILEGRLP